MGGRPAASLRSARAPAAWEWLGGLLIVALAVVATVSAMGPPAPVGEEAPPTRFSSARAMAHVEIIARRPRPTGSTAAREAERYIVDVLRAQGLETEVQAGTSCTVAAGLARCGRVRNVVARRRGTGSGAALMLSAHYDTAPNSPGAADDAAAVAALLETARALAVDPPPRNDVVFLFSDGEEQTLLGAAAFVERHPWFRPVRVAMNFEARGSSGASALFEASEHDRLLIEAFAGSVPRPIGSSLLSGVSRALPNGTDAEAYRRAGVKVLGFAFADGVEHYHQGTDTPDRLDAGSLQHHGTYALALARALGQADLLLLEADRGRVVFFDLFGRAVVRYSDAGARLLALGLGAGFAGLAFGAWRRRRLTPGGLLRSALLFGAAWSAGAVVCALLQWGVTAALPPWSGHTHAGLMAVALSLLACAGALAAVSWARTRRPASELCGGPLLAWTAAALVTGLWAPAASALFHWPLASALGSWWLHEREGAHRWLAQCAAVVPAVVLFTQALYVAAVVTGGTSPLLLLLWLLGGLVPHLLALTSRWRRGWTFPLAAGTAAAVLLGLRVGSGPAAPVGNAVAYAVDAPGGQAFWVSPDPAHDPWKARLLGPSPERRRLAVFGDEWSALWVAPAPLRVASPPRIEVVSDAVLGRVRTLGLRIQSGRGAPSVTVWEATGASIFRWRVDGQPPVPIVRFSPELDARLFRLATGISGRGLWSVTLLGVPQEGMLVELETGAGDRLELRAVDRSDGLPDWAEGFSARGPGWTAGPPGDGTWVAGPPLSLGPAR